MSADNWAYCPKCKKIAAQRQTALELECRESYGKVTAEEYLAMLKKIQNPPELDVTLREDYKTGIDADGEFTTSYSGHCDKCGLSYKFKHAEWVL